MPRSYPAALAASRIVLRTLIVLNLLLGAFILAFLAATLVAEAEVMRAIGVNMAEDRSALVRAMHLIMAIGLLSVPLAWIVLTRLLAIVETVRAGDPFVRDNAARLQTIAWALLGLELLHLAVGAIAAAASTEAQPLDVDWSFSTTAWLAVLLLFVLARAFDHGARMREDLEGTV